MREGYIDYIYALYENRRDLYNHISYIGDRAESAESNRKGQTSIDVTVLEWLLKHTESAYTDSQTHLRNRKFAGTSTNGESNYVKVYTASSYADFKKRLVRDFSLPRPVRRCPAIPCLRTRRGRP